MFFSLYQEQLLLYSLEQYPSVSDGTLYTFNLLFVLFRRVQKIHDFFPCFLVHRIKIHKQMHVLECDLSTRYQIKSVSYDADAQKRLERRCGIRIKLFTTALINVQQYIKYSQNLSQNIECTVIMCMRWEGLSMYLEVLLGNYIGNW